MNIDIGLCELCKGCAVQRTSVFQGNTLIGGYVSAVPVPQSRSGMAVLGETLNADRSSFPRQLFFLLAFDRRSLILGKAEFTSVFPMRLLLKL